MDAAVKSLGKRIRFDALLMGAGGRIEDGSVGITKVLCRHALTEAFIAEYPKVAGRDVVARLFAAYPRIVQAISVDDYRKLKTDDRAGGVAGVLGGKAVADYLSRHGIRHLMLAGIDSSFGLAWVTFYRKDMDMPFDASDAEAAKYLVPDILYRRQSKELKRQYDEMPTSLLPLSVHELRIALLFVQGMPVKLIAGEVGCQVDAVKVHLKHIRARLGISGWKMTAEDLEHPHRSNAARMARKTLWQPPGKRP